MISHSSTVPMLENNNNPVDLFVHRFLLDPRTIEKARVTLSTASDDDCTRSLPSHNDSLEGTYCQKILFQLFRDTTELPPISFQVFQALLQEAIPQSRTEAITLSLNQYETFLWHLPKRKAAIYSFVERHVLGCYHKCVAKRINF